MIRGTQELYLHYPWMKKYPNMSLYVLKHGMDDLIQIPFVAESIDSAEETYKKCNEKGVTWREYMGVTKSQNDIII